MNILLYRPRLNLTSGAGQLIAMQARALAAAGARVRVAAERGTLGFLLRTGIPARRLSIERAARLAAAAHAEIIVDHGAVLPGADLVFVHNLYCEAGRFVPGADWAREQAHEDEFSRALRPGTRVIANSMLVRDALVRQLGLDSARVEYLYPGYRSEIFAARNAPALRARGRRALGLDPAVPVIGLVTSGDFRKRGLDVFLEAARAIAAELPAARFVVVGGRRLPESAAARALLDAGKLVYAPKNRRPELALAALDVLLYPAHFEEFGIVVVEALALCVPVLTSRRVGAAECLPASYAPWLLEAPDASAFAGLALRLLADEPARRALAAAGPASVAGLASDAYARAVVALLAGS